MRGGCHPEGRRYRWRQPNAFAGENESSKYVYPKELTSCTHGHHQSWLVVHGCTGSRCWRRDHWACTVTCQLRLSIPSGHDLSRRQPTFCLHWRRYSKGELLNYAEHRWLRSISDWGLRATLPRRSAGLSSPWKEPGLSTSSFPYDNSLVRFVWLQIHPPYLCSA